MTATRAGPENWEGCYETAVTGFDREKREARSANQNVPVILERRETILAQPPRRGWGDAPEAGSHNGSTPEFRGTMARGLWARQTFKFVGIQVGPIDAFSARRTLTHARHALAAPSLFGCQASYVLPSRNFQAIIRISHSYSYRTADSQDIHASDKSISFLGEGQTGVLIELLCPLNYDDRVDTDMAQARSIR
jgi:hypothetical protein